MQTIVNTYKQTLAQLLNNNWYKVYDIWQNHL